MIVLDDANLDLAIEGGLWGGFGTTGQRCTATSRIIVQKGVYHHFIDRYVERARKLKVGNGLDETSEMGPAINEAQMNRDLHYIEIGRAEGAKIKCGGNRITQGDSSADGSSSQPYLWMLIPRCASLGKRFSVPWFQSSHVKTSKTPSAIANNVDYGLSSSIYTKDVNKAFVAMRDLYAGITYINAPTIGAEVHLPFGGVKSTGNGHREGGIGAIDFYCEWKAVYVDYSDRLQRAQIDRGE